ncbi:MAG TPA: GIY-YIG nuclease family protein [Tissierellaceae bacterium]|nr:GIY-YIG nuclease family protein [Tissierellaceae bacterium]
MGKTKTWIVYAHISPNGKFYIGITCQKPNRRWRNGKGYKHNDYFNNAIKKYGWNNFQHEIIAGGLTLDEANNFEEILIDKLNCNDRNFGYNRSSGGDGVKGIPCSKERKEYLSKTMRGEGNPMYGISLKGMKGKDNPMYGKLPAHAIKVLCVNTGEVFESLTAGAKKYNTHHADISKVCRGIRNYAGTINGEPIIWRYAK